MRAQSDNLLTIALLLMIFPYLLALVGCGSGPVPTYPVRGKVVFADGTPLKGGMVAFRITVKENARIEARGDIGQDGTFQLSTYGKNDGAVGGEHEVLIVPIIPPPKDNQPPPLDPIDRKFSSFATSGLKFTVEPSKKHECVFTVTPPMASAPDR